jgi:hypothetical protein
VPYKTRSDTPLCVPLPALTLVLVLAHEEEKGVSEQEEDAAAEIEALMGRVEAVGLPRVEKALERRRRELGVTGSAGGSSRVVEYRSHADGMLQAEVRVARRKDGSEREDGPYWYFKYQEGGRRRSIYLGRTDEPEAVLEKKRGER